MEIPKIYLDMIGTNQKFQGFLFSRKKQLEKPASFKVIDVRFGSAEIYNLATMKRKHPTLQFLLKSDKMKRAQWCRGIACREILLTDD